jgi:four helix bundle suffix protein
MLEYCRQHNNQEDYSDMYYKATDEELANLALTLCRQVDKMMTTYLEQLEQTFIEEGGIKERMTAARLGRRQTQNETIEAQAHEIEQLRKRINELEEELRKYRGR